MVKRRVYMRNRFLHEYVESSNAKLVVITLTNSCNLECTYCYEHNKAILFMDDETALDIIEKELCKDDGVDFVAFQFFGGEPFIAFEQLKKIYDFLETRTWKKEWCGFMTTNGTLVHGEVQDWILEHSERIELYLSIDGTRDMHNRNRCNSYDDIDIEFFVREYPTAKMTISSETLPGLAEGTIHLHELGFTVNSTTGHGIDWKEEDANILAEQMNKLSEYYMAHPELTPSTILNLESIMDMNPYTETPKHFCGISSMMRSYDVDGRDYPCHAFAPLAIGEEKSEAAKNIDFSRPLSRDMLDDKCKKCPIVGQCPTCYAINFSESGNIFTISDKACIIAKVRFLCNAKFQYWRYESGLLNLTESEELRFLQNIMALQEIEF